MTDWGKLKVTELKEELKTRGIPLTGLKLKADFVAKLEELDTTAEIKEADEAVENVAVDNASIEPQSEKTDQADSALAKEEESDPSGHDISVDEKPIDKLHHSSSGVTILPEMVDMYSSSQIKPTPAQPLTDIIVVQEEKKEETLKQNTSNAPPRSDDPSNISTPLTVAEIIEDSKKRKRRSVTPPPTAEDIALKKAKARDGTPIITKQASALEQVQAATDAAEAIQAPDGLGVDVPIKEDAPKLRDDGERNPSQWDGPTTGNEQPALRISSPRRPEFILDRDVAPALHAATRSLYLRNFKRPLHIPTLRKHLTDIARSSDEDPIAIFHLDNVRTHAFVSFESVTAAARVRSAMHLTVFPDEGSRMPIWVDFIPDDKVEEWIKKESSDVDRNRKWEVFYDGSKAVHQEVGASEPPRKPSATQSRQLSMSEASSRPIVPTVSGVHPDRVRLVPPQDHRGFEGGSARSDSKKAPESDTGTGFKALDELFSSTTTKPKLYYKAASAEVVEDRMDLMKSLRVDYGEMGRSGDEGMKRYSFEVYKGREEWVDKGPEFGFGRRGVDVLEGRRPRGGHRGGRGDRGRGGDSWRGRY